MDKIRRHLAEIFLVGLSLSAHSQTPYPDTQSLSRDEKTKRVRALAQVLGDADTYVDLDIDESTEPVKALTDPPGVMVGSLSDDIYDIYWDLSEGLQLFKNQQTEAAQVKWRVDFDIHWGDHALRSLVRVHRFCEKISTS